MQVIVIQGSSARTEAVKLSILFPVSPVLLLEVTSLLVYQSFMAAITRISMKKLEYITIK